MKFKHVLVASAAAVIAAVAIGSGNAQAAVTHLIGSQDIKDNSVRLADIREGAKHKLSENPQVLAGAGYAPGSHDIWENGYNETIQSCPEGEVVVGGGFSQGGGYPTNPGYDLGGENTDVTVTVSAPYVPEYQPFSPDDDRFVPTQWVVRGYNNGEEPVDVRSWVTCMGG